MRSGKNYPERRDVLDRQKGLLERQRKDDIAAAPAGEGGGSSTVGVKVSYHEDVEQTIYAAADTALVFTDIIFDSSGGAMWSAADPSRFIAPADGLYSFTAGWEWDGDVGTSVADAYLMRNDTTILHYVSGGKRNAVGSDYYQEIATHIYCDAGDEIRLFLHQESGVDQLIRSSAASLAERYRLPHASMVLLTVTAI